MEYTDGAKKASIREWDELDRPREKFMELGPEALSKAELLAILIGSGNAQQSAVDLMRDVLRDNDGSLNKIGKMSLEQLQRYNGLGPAKAVTILAACELGKRRMFEEVQYQKIEKSKDIYDYLLPKLKDEHHEHAMVMMLDAKLHVLRCSRVSEGGISGTAVDIRMVLREALLCEGCTRIVFSHNHPSGNPHPSSQDDELTRSLVKAGAAVHLPLLDHVIVSDGSYYSYSDEGKL